MRNSIVWMITLTLALAAAPFGANAAAPETKQGETMSAQTGCLFAGEEPGWFVLKTGGEQIAVTGPNDLSKHVGHTVKLTGKMTTDSGKKVFQVTQIEQISAGCKA